MWKLHGNNIIQPVFAQWVVHDTAVRAVLMMAQIFSSNRHEAWLCAPDHPQWVTLADILPQEA